MSFCQLACFVYLQTMTAKCYSVETKSGRLKQTRLSITEKCKVLHIFYQFQQWYPHFEKCKNSFHFSSPVNYAFLLVTLTLIRIYTYFNSRTQTSIPQPIIPLGRLFSSSRSDSESSPPDVLLWGVLLLELSRRAISVSVFGATTSGILRTKGPVTKDCKRKLLLYVCDCKPFRLTHELALERKETVSTVMPSSTVVFNQVWRRLQVDPPTHTHTPPFNFQVTHAKKAHTWWISYLSVYFFVSIPPLKPWGALSVGWDGHVCNYFPTPVYYICILSTKCHTSAVLPTTLTLAAALWLLGFQ